MSARSQRTATPTSRAVTPEPDDALETALKNYLGPAVKAIIADRSNKRSADDADEPEPDNKGYPAYGRIYGRQDDPFTHIDTVVNFGIKHETGPDNEEHDELESDEEAEQSYTLEEKRLLHSWNLLCSIVPDFCRQMLSLASHRSIRRASCQQINNGVTTTRADDTASLKIWIPSYILINPNETLTPPMALKSKTKNDRGFYHPVTASLLCPMKYPDTPATYAAIKAGKIKLTAKMLPRFFYPDGHEYDAADIFKGLFQGHLMYRVAKHIFQGPSSALEEPGAHRGKGGNAAICGITSISPRIIAYIATQIRFALSSATCWAPTDGTFSYIDFYWQIVDMLEEDDQECLEIINFFNHHVFGTQDPFAEADKSNNEEAEDDFEIIKQQRAAKRARLVLPDV